MHWAFVGLGRCGAEKMGRGDCRGGNTGNSPRAEGRICQWARGWGLKVSGRPRIFSLVLVGPGSIGGPHPPVAEAALCGNPPRWSPVRRKTWLGGGHNARSQISRSGPVRRVRRHTSLNQPCNPRNSEISTTAMSKALPSEASQDDSRHLTTPPRARWIIQGVTHQATLPLDARPTASVSRNSERPSLYTYIGYRSGRRARQHDVSPTKHSSLGPGCHNSHLDREPSSKKQEDAAKSTS